MDKKLLEKIRLSNTLISLVLESTQDFEVWDFGAIIGTLVDTWCKAHDEDVHKFYNAILTVRPDVEEICNSIEN